MSKKDYFHKDRGALNVLCETIKQNGVVNMIEIGTLAGYSTDIFADYFNVITVDPYIAGYDPKDRNSTIERLEAAYKIFKEGALTKHNVEHYKMTSKEAGEITGVFDFVYIDANHTYEGVKSDLSIWLNKATKYIGGHDYNMANVKKAVNELGRKVVVFDPNHWLIEL